MKKSESKLILNVSLTSKELEEKVKVAMDKYAEIMTDRSFGND